MKKVLSFILIIFAAFSLVACIPEGDNTSGGDLPPDNTDPTKTQIDIYYLNDFHGAIDRDLTKERLGLANIANYLKTKKEKHPDNTIIIAGGDMFQGTVMSNYNNGEYAIELFNEIGFDAFVIGNHEFDWGLDEILKYHNGSLLDKEANYPMLGANVYYKNTNNRVENIKPYTVVEKAGLKIGIISNIGYGLESSILATRVADYEFKDPVLEVKKYAKVLREEEKCDLIISANHDSGSYSNDKIANLAGTERVDVIFNGHDHKERLEVINNVPILEAEAEGKHIGYVRAMFDENKQKESCKAFLIDNDPLLNTADSVVANMIAGYKDILDPIYGTTIIKAGEYFSRARLTSWVSRLMAYATNSDFGFQNYGGTRTDIQVGTDIDKYLIYNVLPFDNIIIKAEVKGSSIKRYAAYDENFFGTQMVYYLDDDSYYTVATNNYIFYDDNTKYLRENSRNVQIFDDVFLSDLMAYELGLQKDFFNSFLYVNDILTNMNNLNSFNILYNFTEAFIQF